MRNTEEARWSDDAFDVRLTVESWTHTHTNAHTHAHIRARTQTCTHVCRVLVASSRRVCDITVCSVLALRRFFITGECCHIAINVCWGATVYYGLRSRIRSPCWVCENSYIARCIYDPRYIAVQLFGEATIADWNCGIWQVLAPCMAVLL